MNSRVGTSAHPLQVAIIGSGPSGFYAAEALLQSSIEVRVDLIERLPVPFGLVRYGVAPDHPKLKEVSQVFARIASHEHCRFVGNVSAGIDVSFAELGEIYHAVIVATGANRGRRLGIPGEALGGVHSATEFVGWYNGHPDCADAAFDFSHEVAVVIGQGNVALDVCRMLCKSVDELRHTDIAGHALEALAGSRIREVHLIGRRGPAQAKFTSKELREFGTLDHCQAYVDPRELQLSALCAAELSDPRLDNASKNYKLLQAFSKGSEEKLKRCYMRFMLTPLEILGEGRIRQVVFAKNVLAGPAFGQEAVDTGDRVMLDAGLVFRSVGYRSVPFDELPFDAARGLIPNIAGMVDAGPGISAQVFVTGWIKRGPTGIIGTNRADSVATVQTLLGSIDQVGTVCKPGWVGLETLLSTRGKKSSDWAAWERIDSAERARGALSGRPREKYVRLEEMLQAGR